VALLFVPICIVPIVVLGRKVRKATTKGWDTNISQASFLVEVLSGIRVVKAFGLESLLVQRFRTTSRQVVHYAMKSVRARRTTQPNHRNCLHARRGIVDPLHHLFNSGGLTTWWAT